MNRAIINRIIDPMPHVIAPQTVGSIFEYVCEGSYF